MDPANLSRLGNVAFSPSLLAEARREPELRAPPLPPLQPDLTAHHLDQLLRDGHSETGAAVLARSRGVGLGKLLEHEFPLGDWDADARVLYREAQHDFSVGLRLDARSHGDLSLMGELEIGRASCRERV